MAHTLLITNMKIQLVKYFSLWHWNKSNKSIDCIMGSVKKSVGGIASCAVCASLFIRLNLCQTNVNPISLACNHISQKSSKSKCVLKTTPLYHFNFKSNSVHDWDETEAELKKTTTKRRSSAMSDMQLKYANINHWQERTGYRVIFRLLKEHEIHIALFQITFLCSVLWH